MAKPHSPTPPASPAEPVRIHDISVVPVDVSDEVKDRVREWVKDLRDPSRNQIQGTLSNPEGMCCLGVKCDTFLRLNPGRGSWGEGNYNADEDRFFSFFPVEEDYSKLLEAAKEGFYSLPPIAVEDFFGGHITVYSPGLVQVVGLDYLNDSLGFTFSQIADVVEARFKL